jgi:hypothetical protein
LPSHYKFTNNLGEGMLRSFWKGSVRPGWNIYNQP